MSKFLFVSCAVLALSACGPKPEYQAIETESQSNYEVPMANAETAVNETLNDVEATVSNDIEAVDNSVEEEAEEAEQTAQLEYVNPQVAGSLFIFRDVETGCEFIQIDDADGVAVISRPSGNGKQRGCGTGTDFKKNS